MNDLKRYKILIVDDVGEYSLALKMYLPENADVLTAESLAQAQEVFRANPRIDLAILDVRLNENKPNDISGMILLSWIREHYRDTPVIMISAYQTIEYELEALERGAVRFLKKPLQPDEVKNALQKVLNP